MSSTGKRLDLRFGAFACSVQGFDDPVQPVQQILRAIQHLLEESPELSDTAINFDSEAIEQLVGEVARRADLDESEVEIVPGLVIIHHGSGGDLAFGENAHDARSPWDGDDSEPAGGDYVNIFASGGDGETGDAAAEEAGETAARGTGDWNDEEGDAEPREEFADRLRRMAAGGGDDYGWAEDETPGGDAEGPAWTGDSDRGEAASVNLFAEGGDSEVAETDGREGPRNLFAAAEDDAGSAAPEDPEDVWELRPAAGRGDDADAPAEETGTAAGEEAEEGYTAASLAERAGARTVPELMLAAAAWMVLIQGQTTFKRRDVLDVFDTIPGEHEKTLEARIKGFGKAVRNEQLVMIEDGVFGLARGELERFQKLL